MQSEFYNFDNDFRHVNYEVSNLVLIDIKDESDLKSDAQRKIYAYFNQKTDNQRLAKREDIVPSEITGFLPFSVISDFIRNDDDEIVNLRFKLIGTAVAEFYGERTGENLSDYVDPEATIRVLTAVKTFNQTRRPLLYISDHKKGAELLKIQIFFIPFASDGDQIDQLFCVFEIG